MILVMKALCGSMSVLRCALCGHTYASEITFFCSDGANKN